MRSGRTVARRREPAPSVSFSTTSSTRRSPVARLYSRRRPDAAAAGGVGVGVVGFGSYFRAMLLPLLQARPASAGLGLRAQRAHDPRRGRERRLREGHHRLPRADRRPRRQSGLRRHAPRPALRDREGGRRGGQARVRRETHDDDRGAGPASPGGGRPQGRPADRRLQPALLAARRAAAGAARPIAAPKTILYRVNAGALPPEHWLLDPSRAAGGCSARACTSSTCCASSAARMRCACTRCRPREGPRRGRGHARVP